MGNRATTHPGSDDDNIRFQVLNFHRHAPSNDRADGNRNKQCPNTISGSRVSIESALYGLMKHEEDLCSNSSIKMLTQDKSTHVWMMSSIIVLGEFVSLANANRY